jgi:polysaccharide deacetylase family sporulation protein PdaB
LRHSISYNVFCTIRKARFILIIAVAVVSLVAIVFATFSAVAVVNVNAQKKLPIYRVQMDEKKVALTFDCAWGVDYTDTLLSVMQEKGIKSTFFAVEFWVNKHPDYVEKIYNAGHELGTHSSTHPHMSKLSRSAIEKELSSSKTAIEKITGESVKVFRAPFGEYTDTVIESADTLNLKTIQWDVDSLDWKGLSANEIVKRVISKVKCGSIVLFHNQGLNTHKALPIIIDELKSRGYEFVSVSELVYQDGYYIGSDGSQIKNGKL